jgi:hypothetical protein
VIRIKIELIQAVKISSTEECWSGGIYIEQAGKIDTLLVDKTEPSNKGLATK